MLLLDSNIFIAYFRQEEEKHAEAQQIIHQAPQIIINDYVLSEIYTVLMLRESYEIAKKVLSWIASNPKIVIQRLTNEEIQSTVAFIQKQKTLLSFVDITLIIMSRERNYELATFDVALKKLKK